MGDLYRHHPVVRACLNGALFGFLTLFWTVSFGLCEVCTGPDVQLGFVHIFSVVPLLMFF